MGDEEEGEVKVYIYEGTREEGEKVEITESGKTDTVQLLGARSGAGKATFPNGDVYEGNYASGSRNGSGKYVYAGATPEEEGEEPPPPVATYDGHWKNGQKNGVGTIKYQDGSYYHGSWANGKRSGQGTFYYANGDIYSGEWLAGQKNGTGTYVYKAVQCRLKGKWVKGVCMEGSFTDKFENTYTGSFADDGKTIGFIAGGNFQFPSGASIPCTQTSYPTA